MTRFFHFFLPVAFLLLNGCAEPSKPVAPPANVPVPAPMVGGDQDEHGCKASAGYTWSVVKNECIRIFESGIRLDAQAAVADKTLSAFVVFKSETEDAEAELFLPGSPKTQILKKAADNGAGIWKSEDFKLTQWKGMYTLEDKTGKVLYEGAAVK